MQRLSVSRETSTAWAGCLVVLGETRRCDRDSGTSVVPVPAWAPLRAHGVRFGVLGLVPND